LFEVWTILSSNQNKGDLMNLLLNELLVSEQLLSNAAPKSQDMTILAAVRELTLLAHRRNGDWRISGSDFLLLLKGSLVTPALAHDADNPINVMRSFTSERAQEEAQGLIQERTEPSEWADLLAQWKIAANQLASTSLPLVKRAWPQIETIMRAQEINAATIQSWGDLVTFGHTERLLSEVESVLTELSAGALFDEEIRERAVVASRPLSMLFWDPAQFSRTEDSISSPGYHKAAVFRSVQSYPCDLVDIVQRSIARYQRRGLVFVNPTIAQANAAISAFVLQKALDLLLGNVLKHRTDDVGKPNVFLTSTNSNGSAVIRIANDQTKQSRSPGMGLKTCADLLRPFGAGVDCAANNLFVATLNIPLIDRGTS
jgi:hypothetical protein